MDTEWPAANLPVKDCDSRHHLTERRLDCMLPQDIMSVVLFQVVPQVTDIVAATTYLAVNLKARTRSRSRTNWVSKTRAGCRHGKT